MRFRFDPNTIPMASGNAHYIFYSLQRDGTVVFRVEFRYSSPNYQVRAMLVNDGTTWNNPAWMTISDAVHTLELDWRTAGEAGANNSGLTFWLGGVQKRFGPKNCFRVIYRLSIADNEVYIGAIGVKRGNRLCLAGEEVKL